MAIKALMVDVDGVLVDGRPKDRRVWHTSAEEDLGFGPDTLHEQWVDGALETALNAGWQALDWTEHSSPNIVRSLC